MYSPKSANIKKDQGLILPTKILRSEFFFRINLKILNPQIFLEKSEKIRSDFLVQLAGQISENKIQEFLIGQNFPKIKNRIQILEIFPIFFVGRIKPCTTIRPLDLRLQNKFIPLLVVNFIHYFIFKLSKQPHPTKILELLCAIFMI